MRKNVKSMPSSYLQSLFTYDETTGDLIWLERDDAYPGWNKKFAGQIAGTTSVNGYRSVVINNRQFYAHRVIWALVKGYWPEVEIDHVDGVRANNRIGNLREATTIENSRNRPAQIRNKSGLKGVSYHAGNRAWRARINVGPKCIYLGERKTPEEAHALYVAAAAKHHGEFSNTSSGR